jgi:hypothetical protein
VIFFNANFGRSSRPLGEAHQRGLCIPRMHQSQPDFERDRRLRLGYMAIFGKNAIAAFSPQRRKVWCPSLAHFSSFFSNQILPGEGVAWKNKKMFETLLLPLRKSNSFESPLFKNKYINNTTIA